MTTLENLHNGHQENVSDKEEENSMILQNKKLDISLTKPDTLNHVGNEVRTNGYKEDDDEKHGDTEESNIFQQSTTPLSRVHKHEEERTEESLSQSGKVATELENNAGTSCKRNSDGPDQVIPSTNTWTTDREGNVKLRMAESGTAAVPPISVPGLLQRTAKLYPDHVALQYKVNNEWKTITFSEYERLVRTIAKAFLHLGLEKYHGVGIIGFNSPEWFLSDLGAIYSGGFAVGLYTTNSPEACQHCLETSEANICVVEDDKQLQKILEIKDNLPHLKTIIQYSGTSSVPGVLSWQEVMKIGEEQTDEKLNEAMKNIAVNECCTLVFTSGTEGKSKAVMLSHDNLTWDAHSIAEYLNLDPGSESTVSYLPLSHVAAQIADIYLTMAVGAKVIFADKDALKGSLVKTLGEVKPTVFLGVPRVWEKIQEKMLAIGQQTTGVKKVIATWGKACCYDHYISVMNGHKSESYRYKFYRWLIFNRIKTALGLDRCKYFMSAAAPLSVEVKKYFLSIDIPVTEAFGMSECAGGHTLANVNDLKLEGVGKTIPGAETKLDNPNEDGHGEVCMRGRHVFMGYLNEPEKTKNALDPEGWLHTGDIGTIDKNGHLHITGRIKELLITAGAENIAPVPIEHLVKKELPFISNAQLIGDKRKFLSILLCLKTEVDAETGAPLDQLTKEVKDWSRSLGCEVNTVTEVLSKPNPQMYAAIQEGFDRVNAQAVSNAQKIQKFAILPADFSVATGELGPTLKLKRNVVYEKYSDIIENFYKS